MALVGCKNLQIEGEIEATHINGIKKVKHYPRMKYNTEYKNTPIYFTTGILSDMASLDKPPHYTSNVEIWFW